MKKGKGFTLVEVLLVIAIISLLSSVILVSLRNTKTKSADGKIKQELTQLRDAIELFYSNNQYYSVSMNNSCNSLPFSDDSQGQ